MSNIDERPYDENGKPHGEWLEYYNDGRLAHRLNYVHGIMDGLNEGYLTNLALWYRGNWDMGIQKGYWYHAYEEKRYYLCLI